MSAPAAETAAACSAVATYCKGKQEGARCLGVFLEGPFFTEEHSGAQDQSFLVDPDLGLLEAWQRAAEGLIVKSALAPEREGATAYIRSAREHGIVCALGHSSASYGQGAQCVLAGANVVVHTFNGMADQAHRDPGLVGLAMTSQGVYAELIADGVHVDPVCCEALVRAKGWEHVVLVTDCLRCGGLPDGRYEMGGLDIELSGGVARLVEGGNLAGSTLTMVQAAHNVMSWGIVTAEQAIRMASEVPARSCGIADRCGAILPGRDADLVVLDPSLNLVETYVGGRLVECV
jgi:N-acetylglucosamine-6-phosphate deacetylase